MAEVGRTVCVRGLPGGIDPERLADKLEIYFLRARNGGGDITSITIKAVEQLALITFEEITVALSALKHSPHIFELDDRKYQLALSFPWQKPVHPSKVILNMSVTIDCSQLPLGEDTVKTLSDKFPDLRVHFLKQQRRCSLDGQYVDVQSVVSQLVELLGDLHPLDEKRSSYGRYRTQGSRNKLGSLEDHGETRPAHQTRGLDVSWLGSNEQGSQSSEILLWKNPSTEGTNVGLSTAQTHVPEERKNWKEELRVEALSLIMEADVFAYLSTRSKEYKHILHRYGVHVVDVTLEGVATLYLQSDAKGKTGSEIEKCMKRAHEELSQLHHQLEGNLRRAQIQRSVLGLRGGETAAFTDLQSVLPKVLLSYDQTNVYIVGERSEVSQAKQILLLGSRDEHCLSSTPRNEMSSSSSRSNSATRPETAQVGGTSGAITAVTPKLHINEAEQKGRGREEYKLAARFKKSEKGFGSGERRKDRELQDLMQGMNMLTLASSSGPTPPLRPSLGTAGKVNHEKVGAAQMSASRIGVLGPMGTSYTGDDDLCQKMGPLTFENTFKTQEPFSNKISRTYSTTSTSTLTPAVKAPPITSVNTLSGLDKQVKAPVLATLGNLSTPRPSLRRANSFSGQPSQKQETQNTGINEKSSHSLKKSRSSSFKSGEQADEHPGGIVSSDIIVSTVMWNYMKEAYQSRLSAMISDLQVSESPAGKGEVRVNLIGSEVSKVGNCQGELQKLVVMIASDFCVQELRLSDLGVSKGNELLEICCSNICSRFRKLSLHSVKDGLLLTGPKPLCSRVCEMLKEVFPHVSHSASQSNTSTYQGTRDPGEAKASAEETLFQNNGYTGHCQVRVDTEWHDVYGTYPTGGRRASQSEPRNGSAGFQSPKQNPVFKEKFKKGGPADLEAGKPGVFLSQSSVVSSPSLTKEKNQKATLLTSSPSTLPVGNRSEPFLCGESACASSDTLRCCPLHAQCQICSNVKIVEEPSQNLWLHPLKEACTAERLTGKEGWTQVRDIHGIMKCVKLPQSLPGHAPHPTAKITYYIPDGIQGDEHPNPGSPFQGGVFHAYLPLSAKGRGLLYCLEKAFRLGLTFTISPSDLKGNKSARTIWDRIPHKINMEGGKSGNGYPDSTYLNDLAEALRAGRIEEAALNED